MITLFQTGARPNEVLNLKGKDIFKQDSYIIIKMPGSKGGLNRSIFLKSTNGLTKELYNFSRGVFSEMFLFYHYRSNCKRLIKGREYTEITCNLRYHFKRWFTGVIDGSIPPYFLRHNKFSTLAEKGVSMHNIQQ